MFGTPPAPDKSQEPSSNFPTPEPAPDIVENRIPPAQMENPASVFQAAPNPDVEAVSAFQAPPSSQQEQQPVSSPEAQVSNPSENPPANPAKGKSEDPSTDRVDDLLRQFRERYGKS